MNGKVEWNGYIPKKRFDFKVDGRRNRELGLSNKNKIYENNWNSPFPNLQAHAVHEYNSSSFQGRANFSFIQIISEYWK